MTSSSDAIEDLAIELADERRLHNATTRELEATEGDLAVAVREARQARTEAERLRRVVQALGALCDAADEARGHPVNPDWQPIEIPWTRAVRAALAEGSGEQPTCEHGRSGSHWWPPGPEGFDVCPGPTDDERPAKDER